MQQMAFYLPEQEDQELSNMFFHSEDTCLVPSRSTLEEACPASKGHKITVQFKDIREYVSGHNYCKIHERWAAANVAPKVIHLNASNKPKCIADSKEWGIEMSGRC